MLKFLRKKNIARIVFWALVILILPAFVFWGTGSLSGSKDKRPKCVGAIGGKKVSFEDFYCALTGIRCQIVLIYFTQPKILDAMFQNKALMGKLAWDRLILLKEADRNKIKANDLDVVSFIQSHPIFTRNGAFDTKIYEHVLRYNIGLDPRGFEEIVRENIRIKKLNDLVAKDVAVTDEDVLDEYKKAAQKFKIEYVLSGSAQFLGKQAVSDKAAKDYYDNNKKEFVLPQKEGEGEKFAAFLDVRESIISYLAEKEARNLALEDAAGTRRKLAELMSKDNLTFGDAAAKLGLKAVETPFFSKADYLDGLGEAALVMGEAARLKDRELSGPVEVRSGAVVFRVSGAEDFDQERFEKEKAEFSKIALDMKRNRSLEPWLINLEKQSTLNIDLKEYDKYYR